jgi:hypothetical protein
LQTKHLSLLDAGAGAGADAEALDRVRGLQKRLRVWQRHSPLRRPLKKTVRKPSI